MKNLKSLSAVLFLVTGFASLAQAELADSYACKGQRDGTHYTLKAKIAYIGDAYEQEMYTLARSDGRKSTPQAYFGKVVRYKNGIVTSTQKMKYGTYKLRITPNGKTDPAKKLKFATGTVNFVPVKILGGEDNLLSSYEMTMTCQAYDL